ncbi:hypothetical protein NEAUS04_1524 [Nematocida ausubeli]|nr:hypothetical protein NEAUS07_1111 [Nematocida ausubeli]KAI5148185.1 hypothetical protein NEAUS05_1287 [Nematocida ausubeli]KAI5163392.1 hypothetical protein NEAUS04_1524 [Nematocida ausubeli]
MNATCKNCRGLINGNKLEEHPQCGSIVLEEIPNGAKIEERKEGRIHCSKCNKVLGRFKWYGAKCMCGRWVFPYIAIHKSNVDML